MAKEQSPQGSCCFLSWGMGSNKARVPSCYETLPHSWRQATGSQLWPAALAEGPWGRLGANWYSQKEKSEQEGRGGGKDYRHTTGIALLV